MNWITVQLAQLTKIDVKKLVSTMAWLSVASLVLGIIGFVFWFACWVTSIENYELGFVFDRVTGKPLWPIEERKVPTSDVPTRQFRVPNRRS